MPVLDVLPGEMWPTCARCGHQVEHIEIVHDALTSRFAFTVECHGATETTEVNEEFFKCPGKISTSTCFNAEALPSAQRALPEAT